MQFLRICKKHLPRLRHVPFDTPAGEHISKAFPIHGWIGQIRKNFGHSLHSMCLTGCKIPVSVLYSTSERSALFPPSIKEPEKLLELKGKNIDRIRKLTGEAIGKFGLIDDGDRILAGISGGKDSIIMLHLLHYFKGTAPIKFDIIAATFDPGYPEFNTEAIESYCREHKWEHHTVKLPMEELLHSRSLDNSPCGLCSRLRRGKLYGMANALKCNKLALGQHLDDLIASFFMSLCRGQGIRTMAPAARPQDPAHPVITIFII